MSSMCVPPPPDQQNFHSFAGSSVIVAYRLVDGVDVDLAGVVAVERSRNVFDELGQSRLVVGGYAFTRGPAFGLRPHSGTIPRSGVVVGQSSFVVAKAGCAREELPRDGFSGWVPDESQPHSDVKSREQIQGCGPPGCGRTMTRVCCGRSRSGLPLES